MFWQLVAQGYFPRETVKHKRKACDRLLSIPEMHAESEKEGEGEREREIGKECCNENIRCLHRGGAASSSTPSILAPLPEVGPGLLQLVLHICKSIRSSPIGDVDADRIQLSTASHDVSRIPDFSPCQIEHEVYDRPHSANSA